MKRTLPLLTAVWEAQTMKLSVWIEEQQLPPVAE